MRRLAVSVATTCLGVCGLTAATATTATTAPASVAHATARTGYALPANVTRECPASANGPLECMALARNDVSGTAPSGYGPADLRSAYNLVSAAATAGSGEQVALLEEGDDPNAVPDFNAYRLRYGLPACDSITAAGCLTVVNSSGLASASSREPQMGSAVLDGRRHSRRDLPELQRAARRGGKSG
jgi:hypothetical protein